MELIYELFVTASVAFLLSFLIAKLISMTMGYDSITQEKVYSVEVDNTKKVNPFKAEMSVQVLNEKQDMKVVRSSDKVSGKVDEPAKEVKVKEEVKEVEADKFEGYDEDGLVSLDDDWEGIERTGLERDFAAATAFVGSLGSGSSGDSKNVKLRSIVSAVETQLYGLHKVAIQGTCHEPQPMAFMLSARAKWYQTY